MDVVMPFTVETMLKSSDSFSSNRENCVYVKWVVVPLFRSTKNAATNCISECASVTILDKFYTNLMCDRRYMFLIQRNLDVLKSCECSRMFVATYIVERHDKYLAMKTHNVP